MAFDAKQIKRPAIFCWSIFYIDDKTLQKENIK